MAHKLNANPGGAPSGDYSHFPETDNEDDGLFLNVMWDIYQIFKSNGRCITDLYTIKYAAGISRDGDWYFRDMRLDPVMVIDGRELEYDFPWCIHECIEREVAQGIGSTRQTILTTASARNPGAVLRGVTMDRIPYRGAHQIAEMLENKIITLLGYDLAAYTGKCATFAKYCADRPLEVSPDSLDLYSYEDSLDLAALDEIAKTGGPVSEITLPRGQSAASTGQSSNE